MTTMKVLHLLGVLGLLLLFAAALLAEEPQPASGDIAPPTVDVIPSDGFNLAIEEVISSDRIVAKLTNPVHNFFAGRFIHLPTDREFTIGLSMTDNDSHGSKGNVAKWVGDLHPVFTYADPTQYGSYEWFTKDAQGRWRSSDPLKAGNARFAGMGDLPIQNVIPPELAMQCLSKDKTYWSPWNEVTTVEVLPALNLFRMKARFAKPEATVAMRIPYTFTFQQSLTTRLKTMQFPGVSVDCIGKTTEGRQIEVIRIEDPSQITPLKITGMRTALTGEQVPDIQVADSPNTQTVPDHQVIVVYAREHGNEPDGSWLLFGVLKALLAENIEAQRLRKNTTWLLIPILDVDASVKALYNPLTDHFCFHENDPVYGNTIPREIVAYAAYLRAFIQSGRSITMVVSLHNVECNETPNIMCPFSSVDDLDDSKAFLQEWFGRLKNENIVAGAITPWGTGNVNHRLNGWCQSRFGAFPLIFEVNSRYPQRRLTQQDLALMGESLADMLIDFSTSERGQQRKAQTEAFLIARQRYLAQYYAQRHRPATAPTPFDIIVMGY